MAFTRPPVTPADGTFSAAGAAAWAAGFGVAGATVGGIPYFPTATTETTSAGLTFNASAVAGEGLAVAAGAATTNVQAFSLTQTWNAGGVTFGGFKYTITDTASAAGSLAFQILGGAAGATNLLSLSNAGQLLLPIGSRLAPSITFGPGYSSFNAGIYSVQGGLAFADNDVELMFLDISHNGPKLRGSGSFSWCSGDTPSTTFRDTSLRRLAAGVVGVDTDNSSSGYAGSLKAALYTGMMGNGAGLGNMVSTATVNTTAVATTGAGPDILMTYDLPLNSLSAAAKGIHITAWGTSANTAEAKTITLEFGSTAILTNALTTSIAGVWRIEADVFSTGTDAQQCVSQLVTTGTAGVALNDVEQGTSAQDDGAAITIRCRGTIGAPSSAAGLVQEGLIVRFHN